jgi:hypothetical protein
VGEGEGVRASGRPMLGVVVVVVVESVEILGAIVDGEFGLIE